MVIRQNRTCHACGKGALVESGQAKLPDQTTYIATGNVCNGCGECFIAGANVGDWIPATPLPVQS
jgi:MinD superfamily P-loop ATPase